MTDLSDQAGSFLGGEYLTFNDADRLWNDLKENDELSLARAVLSRIRAGRYFLDKMPSDSPILNRLCPQEAMLTSKDVELGATIRHDKGLEILRERFDLDDRSLDGDAETLGIAGGIHKRRWEDLGQYEDLRTAAEYYSRGVASEPVCGVKLPRNDYPVRLKNSVSSRPQGHNADKPAKWPRTIVSEWSNPNRERVPLKVGALFVQVVTLELLS